MYFHIYTGFIHQQVALYGETTIYQHVEMHDEIDKILGSMFEGHWRGQGGRVVTLSPPTSEAGVWFPGTASSGKAGSCLPSVYSTEP